MVYDRDDAVLFRLAYIDMLIELLENAEIEEWTESPTQKNAVCSLFATWHEFEEVYPIDGSPRSLFLFLIENNFKNMRMYNKNAI